MSNGNGHHWSKFSWRDWSGDKALHPCSLAARGFWIEMLCLMHEGAPVGHLTLGGKPATLQQMAANACCSGKDAARYLDELETAGVFSRTTDGTIFCRRMVRDAALSDIGREHASKRWSGHKPNGSPNGSPNGGGNGGGIGEGNGTPNAKNLESEKEKESLSFFDSKTPLSPPARESEPSVPAVWAVRREFSEERRQYPAPISRAISTVSQALRHVAPDDHGAFDAAELRDNVRHVMAKRPAKPLSPEQLAIRRRQTGYGPVIPDRAQLRVVS